MDPIVFLTYLAVSHYSFSVVTNIYDYIKFQSNFQLLHTEIKQLKCEIENLNENLKSDDTIENYRI